MKATLFLVLPTAVLLSLSGCSGGNTEAAKSAAAQTENSSTKATPADPEAKIKANIAKFPKEDQAAATEQKFCAVEKDNLLGEMGMPYKLTLDGQTVYLCCKGCEKEARQKWDETLETVKKLKEKSKASAPK